MRKLLLIAILLAYIPVSAQSISRTSSELPKISEPIKILDNATGWVHTSTDQWVSHNKDISSDRAIGIYNAIPSDYEALNGGLKYDFDIARCENFSRIELREVSVEGQNYLILLKHQLKGLYKYPSIRKDWYNFEVIKYYVFGKEVPNEFIDKVALLNTASSIELKTIAFGEIRMDLDEFNDIVNEIKASVIKKKTTTYNDYAIDIFPVEMDGKKFVRFGFRKYSIMTIGEGKNQKSFKYDEFDPLVFDKEYYEVAIDDFTNLWTI